MSKKSRRLIRSGPATEEAPSVAPEPVAAREFYFLPESAPLEVAERDLHELMKAWRHGRATRTIGQVISDSYVVLFTVVLIGAMVISTVMNAQRGMAGCSTEACNSGRLLLPTAMLLAGYALALSISGLFGPVLASAAEGSWLMDAPISRRRLLRGRLLLPVLLTGLVMVPVTGLVAALSGMDWTSVTIWALASAFGSSALVALAASEQPLERTRLIKGLQWLFAAGALAVLVAVVSIAAGWLAAGSISTVTSAAWIIAGVAGLAVIGLGVFLRLADSRLDRIRRARLLSGGSLVSGMQGAMFALDFGLIRDILVERRAMAKGHVRPTKGRGVGIAALIWRDLERLKREPGALIGLAMSLLVPYAADALRMSQLNPMISGLALVAALVPFLGTLRVLTRTGGLARAFPFKTTQLRTAAMAVPAVLALLWALAATPAFIGITATGADRNVANGVGAALVTAAAGLLGGVRWVTAKKPDFGAPMMATSSGALPPTLIFNLIRGFDMVAVITAPLILGAAVYWSAALAVVVFVALRGTYNLEDIKAEQEEAQRELERAKRGSSAEKVKVPRPKR